MEHSPVDTSATAQSSAAAGPTDTDRDQAEPLPKDTLFEILKNRRRRVALAYLKRNGGTATLGDTAEYVAAAENGVEIGALSSSQRKRVYIGLYQCHLPKMADAGVVDYDKDRGRITLRPEAAQFDSYLDDTEDDSSTPTARNLTVAGSISTGVVASLLGVPGFVLVPDVVWALLSAAALVALTVLESSDVVPLA